MGKKYYGGIGTDKGFVMGSSDDELHNGFDDEFHTEGSERSANRNGRPNSTRGTARDVIHDTASDNDRTTGHTAYGPYRENSDGDPGGPRSDFSAPRNSSRIAGRTTDGPCHKNSDEDFDGFRCDSSVSHGNGHGNREDYDNSYDDFDDELDGFFEDFFSVKACIALAIKGLFEALMSRSMRRIDFVAVTVMLLVCMRVIGAVFIDSSSLSELNAFAFVTALGALGLCTISEKCPANALTALVITCLPALIEIATTCAVNGSDANVFSSITSWALIGCLDSAALLIVGALVDPFEDDEESEGETAGMGEGTTIRESEAYTRVFFAPFWCAAIGATAALIWELAPYIAREIIYGAAPIYFSCMGGIV